MEPPDSLDSPDLMDQLDSDPLASTPPAFTEETARRILQDSFAVTASSLAPLAGERDQNFRVDTAGGQSFLFKISNPADGRPVMAMQDAALRHIGLVDPGPAGDASAAGHGGGSRGSRCRAPTAGPTRRGCSRSCPGG